MYANFNRYEIYRYVRVLGVLVSGLFRKAVSRRNTPERECVCGEPQGLAGLAGLIFATAQE